MRPFSKGKKNARNQASRESFADLLTNGQRWLIASRGGAGVRTVTKQLGYAEDIPADAVGLQTCETSSFKLGDEVELCGLVSKAEVNGHVGVLVEYLAERVRWTVLLGASEMAIKSENFIVYDRHDPLTQAELWRARNVYLSTHRASLKLKAAEPGCNKSVDTLALDIVKTLPTGEQIALLTMEIPAKPDAPARAMGRFAQSSSYASLSASRKRALASDAADRMADSCETVEDAEELIGRMLKKLEGKFPNVNEQVRGKLNLKQDACCCRPLLTSLHEIRQECRSHHAGFARQLDSAVRGTGITRGQARRRNYPVRDEAWRLAAGNVKKLNLKVKVGRPSKVMDPAVVKQVKAVVRKHVNPSSNLAVVRRAAPKRGVKRRLAPVHVLNKKFVKVWRLGLRDVACFNTCRSILKKIGNVRKPRRQTDMCKHCMTYTKKYMPAIMKAVREARDSIVEIAPSYFEDFTDAENLEVSPMAAATIKRLLDWIGSNNEKKKALRRALPYLQKSPLLRKESAAKKHLGHFHRVAKIYEWHKQTSRRQHDSKQRLHADLPRANFSIDSDYKEAFKTPVGNMLTGEDHFAPAQSQIGVFGAVLHQRVKGKARVDKYLYISKVAEHPPFVTNILWDKVLCEVCDMDKQEVGHFWSDCGNHYRSYCSLDHVTVTIPKTNDIKTMFHNCCERHGKSDVDALFGEFDMAVEDYLDAEDASITDIDELERVLVAYFKPKPRYHVRRWVPEALTPDTLHHLDFKGSFHVTRSYCIESVLDKKELLGVQMRNHVFSDCDAYTVIHGDRVATTGNSREYRFSIGKEIPFAKQGVPKDVEKTEIARRYDAQCDTAPTLVAPWKSQEDRFASKLKELDRRSVRAAASAKRSSAASSSSTSSSDDSSDDSSDSSDSSK